VDAQSGALGNHEQLGVEKPVAVLDLGQKTARNIRAQGLEAALRVPEANAQAEPEQHVVGAADQLALHAAGNPRTGRQTAADGHLAVSRQYRRNQRQQRAEVRGEVHVHVGDDTRVAR